MRQRQASTAVWCSAYTPFLMTSLQFPYLYQTFRAQEVAQAAEHHFRLQLGQAGVEDGASAKHKGDTLQL